MQPKDWTALFCWQNNWLPTVEGRLTKEVAAITNWQEHFKSKKVLDCHCAGSFIILGWHCDPFNAATGIGHDAITNLPVCLPVCNNYTPILGWGCWDLLDINNSTVKHLPGQIAARGPALLYAKSTWIEFYPALLKLFPGHHFHSFVAAQQMVVVLMRWWDDMNIITVKNSHDSFWHQNSSSSSRC